MHINMRSGSKAWLLSPYAMEFVLYYLIPQRVFYCVVLYFFSYVQHPAGVLQSEQPFQATVILNAPIWVQPLLMYQDKHSGLQLPLTGYSMVMMFTAIHEATHRSVSRIPWLNDLIGTVTAFLYMPGMSTTVYRYLHLSHHRYTGDIDKDPDAQYVYAPFLVCLLR